MTFPEPGEWAIDAANSSIIFSVRHMLVSRITGRFGGFAGRIHIGDSPFASTVVATIDPASIDTGHPERDTHVRGGRFLDAQSHPEITYRSRKVDRESHHFIVSGDLTLKGVTQPVTLRLDYGGVVDDPLGHRRAGFTATAQFSRSDFDVAESMGPMPSGGVVVGDTVEVTLDIEAIKKESP
ncbi:YceI family protein [Actinomadura chibensis]|uniref:YceI family protein n=1 Tax=Actinomadura chibensis TaxID=392828 RepID=A0A5D0NUI4_9ACTN|nr:YceI family protein [Actinomadura chibensis]TYB47854.1 YceI family protein [Actinomadura chibensis]